LLTTTPSTTYNGDEFALMEVMPRSWICDPPPGAPELVVMIAPGSLPCSAFSIIGVGAFTICSADSEDTDCAALALETDVAAPVMTTRSSSITSFSSLMSMSF